MWGNNVLNWKKRRKKSDNNQEDEEESFEGYMGWFFFVSGEGSHYKKYGFNDEF